MIVATTSSFVVGKYTVQQRPRFDNPAFAVFIIFLGAKLIGKQFSMPSVSDCDALKRAAKEATPLAVTERVHGYGRRAAFPVSVCERCGSKFTRGLSSLCVPCKESRGERR